MRVIHAKCMVYMKMVDNNHNKDGIEELMDLGAKLKEIRDRLEVSNE